MSSHIASSKYILDIFNVRCCPKVTWEECILKYFMLAHKMSLGEQHTHVTARFSGNSIPVTNTLKYMKSCGTKVFDNSIKWNTDL